MDITTLKISLKDKWDGVIWLKSWECKGVCLDLGCHSVNLDKTSESCLTDFSINIGLICLLKIK